MGYARPVVHFEIHGKDAKKLQDFYAALFDWQIDANNPMSYGMVSPGIGGPEAGVGGGITASPTAPFVTVYVQVASLDDTLRQVESMGGKTVMPPMDVPDGPTIAMFSDPEGNVIGLVQQ
jgi:predicted enzyme related to lactoylglutathione lyase